MSSKESAGMNYSKSKEITTIPKQNSRDLDGEPLKEELEKITKLPIKRVNEDEVNSTVEGDLIKKAKVEDEVKKPTLSKGFAIKIGTPTQKKVEPKLELLQKPSVFGDDDDDEVEEMPPEAKMRMKNIGRDTQTSSGPNSFGKTRQGFCDTNKVLERQLQKAIDGSENS